MGLIPFLAITTPGHCGFWSLHRHRILRSGSGFLNFELSGLGSEVQYCDVRARGREEWGGRDSGLGGEDPVLVRFQKVLSESARGGRRRCTALSSVRRCYNMLDWMIGFYKQ